jgi:hypothetical protein
MLKCPKGEICNKECLHKKKHERNEYCFVKCIYDSNLGCEEVKEMDEPTYRQLKPITGKNLYDAGACKEELERFITLFGFQKDVPFEIIIKEVKSRPSWIDFLLTKGFIEEVKQDPEEEVVANIGDKFTILGERYILAATRLNALGLINIENGTRWHESVETNERYLTRRQFRERLNSQGKNIEEILKTKERR